MATVVDQKTTDATGKATLAVPAGSVTVGDTPPAGYTAAPPQTVTVAAGQTVPVTLQVQAQAGTLDVVVVDQFNRPVPGVVVTASE